MKTGYVTDAYQSSRRPRDNMNLELRDMVTERVTRISSADKGGALVVQNTNDYVSEGNRQLQNRSIILN